MGKVCLAREQGQPRLMDEPGGDLGLVAQTLLPARRRDSPRSSKRAQPVPSSGCRCHQPQGRLQGTGTHLGDNNHPPA